MEPIPGDMISIIGGSYFQPIADLIKRLSDLPANTENDVQVSPNENGYSVSIILLLVTMFESYVMRVRYINREKYPIKQIRVTNYLRGIYPDYSQMAELSEVFSLRDLIAHNHLWEIDFFWSEDPGMKLTNATLEGASGDKKFRSVIDESTRKTKILGLNIVPIRVGRADVRKIFKIVWDALLFLESKDRNQCYVSHLHIVLEGKTRLFGDLDNAMYD